MSQTNVEPIRKQIAAMERMTVGQLRERYAEVFGEPARSGNRQWLFRRIAWRIQMLAEGDLATRALERARDRAKELARDADLRARSRAAARPGAPCGAATRDRDRHAITYNPLMILNKLAIASGALALLTLLSPARAQAQAPDAEAIGSTRNSRPTEAVRAVGPDGRLQALVYLASAMSEEDSAELARVAPGVRIINGLNRQTALEHAPIAQGADAHLLTPEFLAKAPNLVWVQSHSAGVDRYVTIEGLADNDRILLTNMRAAHGPAIADHSFAMLLSLTRNLRGYEKAQSEGSWKRDVPGPRPIALQGRTMLVVGLGGIGSEIAQRAHGFGMRVIGTRRSDAPNPDWIERVGKPDDLLSMLPEADVVAIAVPLTQETEGLFNAKALAAMKPGAYLINIARGRVVDTDALLSALRSGKLAGACLDVTDPEPLPAGHPLWNEPNAIITPHMAATADLTNDRSMALFLENMRRFDAGEPLLNVVDKEAGY